MLDQHLVNQLNPFKRLAANSLNRRVALYILLFSSAITLLMTAYQLLRDYQIESTEITNQLDSISVQTVPVLSRSLWEVNLDATKRILIGLYQLPHIAHVSLIDEFGQPIESLGKPAAGKQEIREYSLSYLSDELAAPHAMGTLVVNADIEHLRQKIWDRVVRIAYTQALKTMLVTAFILLMLYHLIGRHISRITGYTQQYPVLSSIDAPRPETPPLSLNRPSRQDELTTLVDSINLSHQYLAESYHTMREEVAARRNAEASLSHQYTLIEGMLDTLNDAIFELDKNAVIEACNQAAYRLLGQPNKNALIGKQLDEFVRFHPSVDASVSTELDMSRLAATRESMVFEGTMILLSPRYTTTVSMHITPLSLSANHKGLTLVVSEIEDNQKFAEVQFHATHDYLTGLQNRFHFDTTLKRTLHILKQDSSPQTLALIDLDNFKPVNDVYGHITGDLLLKQVSGLLVKTLGEHAHIARIGGDEFAVISPEEILSAEQKLQRVIADIERTELPDISGPLYISASIGLTLLSPSDTPATALARADAACYTAKTEGGNTRIESVDSFEAQVHSKQQDYDLLQKLVTALQKDQFLLYGQAITPLDLGKGLSERTEILLRHIQNDRNWATHEFLAVANRYRFSAKIDLWVLENVSKLMETGQLPHRGVNINLSLQSMNNLAVQVAVEKVLALHARHYDICFEITEDALVSHLGNAQQLIAIAKANGAKFAIDDFGKGYASFGMIATLPVDYIKIDGSLISNVDTDTSMRAIVNSIVVISKAMNALTVAEHVPNAKTRKMLLNMGVHFEQSFANGKPYPLTHPVSHPIDHPTISHITH